MKLKYLLYNVFYAFLTFQFLLPAFGGSSITVEVKVSGNIDPSLHRFSVYQYWPMGKQPVFSNFVGNTGSVVIPFESEECFVRLVLHQGNSGNDIIAGSDIILSSSSALLSVHFDSDGGGFSFPQSPLNQAYSDFVVSNRELAYKVEVLERFVSDYPDKSDLLVRNAQSYAQILSRQFLINYKTFASSYSGSIAGLLTGNQAILLEKTGWVDFWRGVNLDDRRLFYTPFFENAIGEYYARRFGADGSLATAQGLRGFADSMIANLGSTDEGTILAVRVLVDHFTRTGNDSMLSYVDDNYSELLSGCEAEGLEASELQRRLEAFRRLQPGQPAPPVSFLLNGQPAELNSIDADTLILVFYSTGCPHCVYQLPELNNWLEMNQDMGVGALAVSLETDRRLHDEFTKSLTSMIHHNDFKGGASTLARDYSITGVPTYFVLDQNRNIILKSNTLFQVLALVSR